MLTECCGYVVLEVFVNSIVYYSVIDAKYVKLQTWAACPKYKAVLSKRVAWRVLRGLWKSTLHRLIAKEKTSWVNGQPTPVHERNARSVENTAAVRESVQENPNQSIPFHLHERFECMNIFRRGDVNKQPRLCYLTPVKFFLWGFWNLGSMAMGLNRQMSSKSI